ncbi:hypothetical protein HAX54_010445, partial [Datura stramonium]|nr:hypothetical protein [Datura stramonium]
PVVLALHPFKRRWPPLAPSSLSKSSLAIRGLSPAFHRWVEFHYSLPRYASCNWHWTGDLRIGTAVLPMDHRFSPLFHCILDSTYIWAAPTFHQSCTTAPLFSFSLFLIRSFHKNKIKTASRYQNIKILGLPPKKPLI